MPRITPVDPETATGRTKQLLNTVQAQLGATPNLMRTLAASPSALDGFLKLAGALAGGRLDRRFQEQIALAVAETNSCEYCLAAHSTLGALAGLSAAEIADARAARSFDSRRDAGLKFVRAVVVQRGQITDAALADARAAGLVDAEIVEMIANIALNVLTNYINHVAATEVDFPAVDPLMAASA